jgi:general secretion pathway protein K
MTARRGASSFTVEQGLQFGNGAELIAAYALVQDMRPRGGRAQAPMTDHDGDIWTRPFPPTEVAPGITFEALLRDESGKFNLNALASADPSNRGPDAESLGILEKLLTLLDIETRWAAVIADYVDADTQQSPNGAEDGIYTSQRPPHRAPNAPITSVSELMVMPGFSREDYLKLLPHVTALPPMERRINVCFATGAVLDALDSQFTSSLKRSYIDMDPKQLEQIKSSSCADLMRIVTDNSTRTAPEIQSLQARLANQSTYFRLHTWVTIGTTRFALYSLMQRDGTTVRVVNRTFGTE